MSIRDNVALVRQNIAAAARSAGRRPEDVLLLAATKTQPLEAVEEAIAAGVDLVGENRAQEFRAKSPLLGGFPCHFLGRLQRNKLKYLVGYTELIHSVDHVSQLVDIDALAGRRHVRQDILCEVNIGEEQSKGGILPGQLSSWFKTAQGFENIRVRGLMCVPPRAENDVLERYFSEMQKLYVDIRMENMDNTTINILSMGMSGDYTLAVTHGATLVRVGSSIFGTRLSRQGLSTEGDDI